MIRVTRMLLLLVFLALFTMFVRTRWCFQAFALAHDQDASGQHRPDIWPDKPRWHL